MRAFTFRMSEDWGAIHRIMTHSRVYPHITDDHAPAPEAFTVARQVGLAYVMVEEGQSTLGLFLLEQRNGIQVEVHTCLLPAAWLRDSRAIAAQAMAWLWENCPQIERLTTTVPRNNTLALRFAEALGMVEYGMNPSSFLKGGKLMDQTLLGMNRPKGDR